MSSSVVSLAPPPHSSVHETSHSEFAHRLEALEARLSVSPAYRHEITILLVRGDLDALMAALTLAASAATMGGSAHVFFAFRATLALRRPPPARDGSLVGRMFGWMRSEGAGAFDLPRMLRDAMMTRRLRALGIPSLEELMATCAELGVRFHVCSTTMKLIGLTLDDLVDYPGLDLCGVATFVEHARESRVAMTI
jgi:peroxiredoxin family protein